MTITDDHLVQRRRPRRIQHRVLAAASLGAVTVATVILWAAVTEPGARVTQPASDGGAGADAEQWTALSTAPVDSRARPIALAVGDRAVFLGGTREPACPPSGSCVHSGTVAPSDGAVYHPRTDEWTAIPPAPAPIEGGSAAVVDNHVYVLSYALDGSDRAFLRLDLAAGEWTRLEAPEGALSRVLLGTSTAVIAYARDHERARPADLIFDPKTGSWSELPGAPLPPLFDRSLIWTGRELVVLGLEVVPHPGRDEQSRYLAAIYDGEAWEPLEKAPVGFWSPSWFAVSGMVVNPSTAVSGPRDVYPTGGLLEVATRSWQPLPALDAAPPATVDLAWLGGTWDDRVIRSDLAMLNVTDKTWSVLPAPPFVEGMSAVVAGDHLVVWGAHPPHVGQPAPHAGWRLRLR